MDDKISNMGEKVNNIDKRVSNVGERVSSMDESQHHGLGIWHHELFKLSRKLRL